MKLEHNDLIIESTDGRTDTQAADKKNAVALVR
jgi:hypothetical protein